MTGTGASPEGDRPFIDLLNLNTQQTKRLWRSEAPSFERPVAILNAEKGVFLTSRESNAEPPNYFIRNLNPAPKKGKKPAKDALTQITFFPHPYPQFKDIQKQQLRYKRSDGVDLTATLLLPPGYKKEDGPLPTFLWAYPAEFKSAEAASQASGSPYTFNRISYWTGAAFVTMGYAVLENASIPIIGEGKDEPNDTYVQQLVASAKAAIDEGVRLGVVDSSRVGVGGHSYGAFMTANLLSHSKLFKAGIARSGAYNRTLTPFGFQNEQRTYWQSPEVYNTMSPFMNADKMKTPLLMTHGEADNNTGTYPIQSERYYNALKGMGATTKLVFLPYESHGYIPHRFGKSDGGSNGAVVFRPDLFTNFDNGKHGAGRRRIAVDRNAVFIGDFADPSGDFIDTLGHANWRSPRRPAPFQCHCIVRRVDDDNIRGWRVGQHLAHRDLVTPLPPLLLHMGVAVLLLRLVHDLFAGHHVLAKMFGRLPEIVDTAQHTRDDQHDQQKRQAHPDQNQRYDSGIKMQRRKDLWRSGQQKPAENQRENQKFHETLEELEQAISAKLVLGILDHRDPAGLGFQLVGRHDEGPLRDDREQHRNGGHREPGQQRQDDGHHHCTHHRLWRA